MLGGYQILDLRSIDLTIGSSASNITDIYVLNQLRSLREHIQKDYTFARPLNKQIKPVLIRYRDKKNGEKQEGAIFGCMQVKTNYYTFEISAILIGQTLNIEVVFEEKTDDDGNKYFDIKTAKILLTNNADIKGDLAVDGDLAVTGAISGASATLPIINGENNPSVKPIYYHGLELGNNTEGQLAKFYFNPHILTNNDNLVDTIDKFIAWAKSITGEVTINGNGVYTTGGNSYPMIMLRKNANNSWALLYLDASYGWRYVSIADDDALKVFFNTCRDSVNKIN